MKRYFIEEAKCGVTDGGIACGPIPGNVVVGIKFKENGKSQWISFVEVDGIPNVYLSDKDIFDDLVKEDVEDTEFTDYINEHFIREFNGIAFGLDYSDLFNSVAEDPDNEALPLIRYMVALVRCSLEEVDDLISMATGRYADELDIPISDVEEEYLEDLEEE